MRRIAGVLAACLVVVLWAFIHQPKYLPGGYLPLFVIVVLFVLLFSLVRDPVTYYIPEAKLEEIKRVNFHNTVNFLRGVEGVTYNFKAATIVGTLVLRKSWRGEVTIGIDPVGREPGSPVCFNLADLVSFELPRGVKILLEDWD